MSADLESGHPASQPEIGETNSDEGASGVGNDQDRVMLLDKATRTSRQRSVAFAFALHDTFWT